MTYLISVFSVYTKLETLSPSNACAAHVLSEGANNLYVGVLQIGLYAHNITLNSGIDSSFGPSTKQGVIKFQTSQGLSADGIAGRDTFARLAGV